MKRLVEFNVQHKLFSFLCVLLFLLLMLAIFGKHLAPHDPLKMHPRHLLESGSAEFPLGTDEKGRCVLSRILYGGRNSIFVILIVVALTSVIGSFIGIFSAIMGGRVDTVIMRIVDMLLAFPGMIFTIALVGFLGVSFGSLIIAMSVLGWLHYTRVSRALTLGIKNSNFIAEARLGGANTWQLIIKYFMPNLAPHMLVLMTQNLGIQLLTISSLSLLGLGAQPPTPEWGAMLSAGKPYMQQAPWLLFYPGFVILIYAVIFNLIGDALRDIFDPQQNALTQQKGRLFV